MKKLIGGVLKEPLTLKEELTVMGLAEKIHSGLSKNFKYVKVWSSYFPFKLMEASV